MRSEGNSRDIDSFSEKTCYQSKFFSKDLRKAEKQKWGMEKELEEISAYVLCMILCGLNPVTELTGL